MSNQDNQKRIAKNTLFLYIRMMFTMLIALYTSRIVLRTLGVEDYGIYNVVGSIIAIFSFANSAIASATQRFLAYEIGKKDRGRLSKVFNISLFISLLICFSLLVISESVGYWFVSNKMNIPLERMEAAMYVYQFSIFSCILSVIMTTYKAIIIAHEKMSCYAYISITESILKLIAAFVLVIIEYDKLKSFSFLLFLLQIILLAIYVYYCKRNFTETKLKIVFDKSIFKEIISFSAWNLMGCATYVASNQGVNILLNIFVGPIANAARGISIQVQSAVQNLGGSFQQALNPQITKSYASKDFRYMHSLIVASSKYTFFLLLLISLPIFMETEKILGWWLGEIPKYTVNFVRITIAFTLITCVSNSIIVSAFATGRIRTFQIIDSAILFLQLPISFLLLSLGFAPESVFITSLILEILMLTTRIIIVFPKVKMSIIYFIREAIFPILKVGVISLVIPIAVNRFTTDYLYAPFLVIFFSVISVLTSICIVGLSTNERRLFKTFIFKSIHYKK